MLSIATIVLCHQKKSMTLPAFVVQTIHTTRNLLQEAKESPHEIAREFFANIVSLIIQISAILPPTSLAKSNVLHVSAPRKPKVKTRTLTATTSNY